MIIISVNANASVKFEKDSMSLNNFSIFKKFRIVNFNGIQAPDFVSYMTGNIVLIIHCSFLTV